MDVNYFDLSGGINQASTKTELGLNTKTIFWTDSKNVEIYDNKGIIRQKGNTLLFSLPEKDSITGLCEIESDGNYKLVITTKAGKIYIYSAVDKALQLLEKTITGKKPLFAKFLRGVVVATESDEMFYIKDNNDFDIVSCNFKDKDENPLHPSCITIYKGRLWCGVGSTVYYSALGTYNDFKTEADAGYINDFHTDTADIVSMNTYKNYLAIYKKERVYLLSGSNPSDFAILPFADKGAIAAGSIINVDNKQFFLSNGIYALEQVGELNQIRLGSEISTNIKEEFNKFDYQRIQSSFAIHYQNYHQMWYFFPYINNTYYNVIWINDYINHSWYKRVLPQKITTAVLFNSNVLTADEDGNVYKEYSGSTFNGDPIEFMWKSPFLSLGSILRRKIIDEFYFVLDGLYDNKFQLSIYKDFDSEYTEDYELIYSRPLTHLFWAGDDTPDTNQYRWTDEAAEIPVWSISTSTLEKAEICGSNYSVQLCIEGKDITDNCAIIGLQFREIYNDD